MNDTKTFTFPFFTNEEGLNVIHLHDEDVLLVNADFDEILLFTEKDWIAGTHTFEYILDYSNWKVTILATIKNIINDTNKFEVDVDELTSNWWFVYSDEVDTIEKLNTLDMDDVFHLIRIIYISYIPVKISDWRYDSGDLWITFAKE